MKDVARKAGVSLKTVSRVMNHEPGVREATSARVMDAAGQLGFRRNDVARTLRRGRSTASIGLVIENVADPFYSVIAYEVERAARARGYLVFVGSSEEDPDSERALVEEFCSRRVDGLLIVPTVRDHRYLVPEVEMGIAAVFLDRPPNGIEADTVVADNVGGVESAVRHLAGHGHRRIGYVGVPDEVWTGKTRLDAFQSTVTALGLEPAPELTRLVLPTVTAGESACLDVLTLTDPPTALVTGNNRISVGAVRALRRLDSSDGVAIVGFDDFELADVLRPAVTVVAQDSGAVGRCGVEALFGRIAGDHRAAQHVTLPTRLIERGSGEIPGPYPPHTLS